ncbi:gliding motility-associated C-terminal domain-containing protein [Ferruginibacter albus]|uniref:gliding motility-associated C-terminal domain-containing protein n=1 Tax=Ferruginibacter albus TaxID=2875540 RepID=UPI001CC39992|nr:gliding motility-associated C-terminal domain-containing protein [Ferruginibacter albus]UAY53525.1 gliding motility-associated C-terminal domain-containing protein [Ferruginibacter albus]
MKIKIFFLFVSFLTVTTFSYAQLKRAAHWYFGYQAGLDFSLGTPHADTTGKLISIEGCSTMSDTTGKLLFYSNGEMIWNSHHLIMPNGNQLIGDQSSSQSSLIVPKPGNDFIYYLFSSVGDIPELTGLRYTIIDMSLDGGLGDVISKDNLLFTPGTESLAGTMHCNAKDYWIVSVQFAGTVAKFYAYLLNSTGLNSPVISTLSIPSLNNVAFLNFSQDGKLLALNSLGSAIYLFDFNTQTGQLTLKQTILDRINENVYSNAISPDNSKLYITSWVAGGYSYLSQFNLTASNITASRVDIDSVDYRDGSPNGYGFIGQVKLAPDQRMYVSRWNQDHPFQTNPDTYYSLDSIDVVNFPNLSGNSCGFQRNFLCLDHKPTMEGLPNFISNFTSLTPPDTNACANLGFTIINTAICAGESYQLPSGGLINKRGTYKDTVRNVTGNDSLLTIVNLTINPIETISITDSFYNGQSYTLPSGNRVNAAGVYQSILKDRNGCDSIINTTLKVRLLADCILNPPKAFTPNEDGNNDVWVVTNSECIRYSIVNIYNRWGGLVYHSDNYNNDWDGKYQNKPVADGTYYYVIKAIYNDSSVRTLTGNVTIIR